MHDAIGTRPVTVVVAAAGYGKTTALRGWLEGQAVRWCTGAVPVPEDGLVVVDHPVGLPEEPPATGRLVLVSRTPLVGPVDRWRRQGLVTDIGPADLALSDGRVAELLAGPAADRTTATTLAGLTGGWPMLVRLTAEALSGGTASSQADPVELARALAGPGTALHRFVTEEVCGDLTPAARRLLLELAEVPWATEELVLALNHRDGRRNLRHLAAVGVVQPAAGGPSRLRVVPLMAAALDRSRRPAARVRTLTAAAKWYADHGEPAVAVRTAVAAGDRPAAAALLARQAEALLSRGEPATLCWAVRALPAEVLDDGVRLLYAEALYVTGDIDESMHVYSSLDGGGPLPAALAWRYGLARCLHGDPAAGLDVLRRGIATDDADGARLLAWLAAAYWRLGDADACGRCADQAEAAARAAGDGRAVAAAHVGLALHAQLTGDRPAIQAHYERALAAAESVADGFSIVRIRTNRASSLAHEARYADALRMVEPAIELAEAAGYVALLAPALCNQGDALTRLGRLDEAVATFERAATLYQRMRTDKLAYALVGLGDVYRLRGRTSQARAVYEEAIRAVSGGGNWQAMVRALAGLARVVAPTDRVQATALAERALAQTQGPLLAIALVAAGWVRATGTPSTMDLAEARRLADAAADAARRHRDRVSLAEALELSGFVADDQATAQRMLTEALGIWVDAGADLDADRVRLGLAGRVEARLAADRLAGAGVAPPGAGTPPRHGPASTSESAAAPDAVRLSALGRFAVSVGGTPVPLAAWRSRKARDLMRVLVGRRGRSVPRDELAQLLWPDEPGHRVAHRLSVALSEARAVLDPGRRAGADHFIAGDTASLALNRDRLTIDAEVFAEYARYGLDRLRAGEVRDARAALEAAEQAYTGDFLDDEPYDDHAAAVREQLRATFLQVTRALADLTRAAGDPDEAVRCLLRLLGADPYDERAHCQLIDVLSGCGRHGEARRARGRYVEAMREIGVPVPASGSRVERATDRADHSRVPFR